MFYTIIDPGLSPESIWRRGSLVCNLASPLWHLPCHCKPNASGNILQCSWLTPMQSIATQCSATREVWLEGRHPPSPPSSPNCSQVSSNVNCHQSALQHNAIGNNAPPRFQIATLDRATPFITWLVTAGTTMLQLLQSEGDHTWQPCLILVKGLWKFISVEVKDDQYGW